MRRITTEDQKGLGSLGLRPESLVNLFPAGQQFGLAHVRKSRNRMSKNKMGAQHHFQMRNRLRPWNRLPEQPLADTFRSNLNLKFAGMFQIARYARSRNARAVFGFDRFLQALGKIILVQRRSFESEVHKLLQTFYRITTFEKIISISTHGNPLSQLA